MVTAKDRTALNGLEERLFKLVLKGATAAQWAEWLRAPLEHAVAEGDKDLAMTLLQAGANGGAGWKGCGGRTLLDAAAEGGNDEVVSSLLAAGGSKEMDVVSGSKGMTALHRAIAGGHVDAARVLMLAGADVNLLDYHHGSPLHYAIEGGHLQLAEDMGIVEAELDAKDSDGNTFLHLAASHDNHAFVNMLLRKGASVGVKNGKGEHPLHVAVEHGHIAVAEALLKAGADPNVFVDEWASPLFDALGNMAMMVILIENGADTNVVDQEDCTALHEAAYRGKPEEIDALVEAGANLEARSGVVCFDDGFNELTPLHLAARFLKLGNMAALLRQGANVNPKDDEGRTPLHLVCEVDCTPLSDEAADLLLRWGADETITNNNGRTPVDLIESDATSSTARRLRRILANAPADKAWRRRGMLVMCRAHSDQTWSRDGEGRPGKVMAHDGAGSRRGSGNVVARVVDLEDNAIFRYILGFL